MNIHFKDLIVTGDARILGKLYTDAELGGGGGGGEASGNYTLEKSGSTITLKRDGSPVSSVQDSDTISSYSHPTYTSRTGQPTANQSPAHNGSFNVSQVTTDGYGHVTDLITRTITLPAAPTVNNGTLTIQKNGSNVATFSANQSGNVTANITVPTKYSDLTGLPTIPSVGNGTLTIQKNGSNVTTFTANQSGNATANITVPTKVTDLTDSGNYLTTLTRYAGSDSPGGAAHSAAALTGGPYVAVSSSEPTNTNCLIWIKTS